MPTRTLQIVLAGDPASASRAFKKVGDDAERMGKRVDREGGRIRGFATVTSKGFGRVGVAAGGMAVAGAGAAALLAKSFVSGATDINESLSKNEVLFGKHADAVDKFSQNTAKKLGISRQAALEATGTFGNLFVALDIGPKKSAGMSQALTTLAADLASFNNASPEEALEAIRSGLVGETEPLRRFGVNLNDATLRAEALRLGLVKNTKEALDPQTKALAVNSLLFKQTEKAQGDFARTSGGLANQQRILKARLADAGAELGSKLMPIALDAVKAINSLFDSSTAGGKAVQAMGRAAQDAAGWLKRAWQDAVTAARKFLDDHKRDVDSVVSFVRRIGGNLREALGGLVDVVKGVVSGDWKKAWGGAKRIAGAAIENLKDVVRVAWDVVGPAMLSLGKLMVRKLGDGLSDVPGIVRGELSKIPPVIKRGWDESGPAMESFGKFLVRKLKRGIETVPSIVDSAIHDIPPVVKRGWDVAAPAMVSLGKMMVRKVVEGMAGLGKAIQRALRKGVMDAAKEFGASDLLKGPLFKIGEEISDWAGDGIGKQMGSGLGFMGGTAGASGAGLRGADMDLGPFARIGAGMGLTVSSGLRPGAVTSSGNPSFHGTGDAIDMAGSPGGMMRFFKTMRGMFGSRLRELIYTPGGVGIKDGRPFRYSGKVAADHHDHVHVAYTGPFGDGIGQIRNLWTKAGGSAAKANLAAAIAMAESSGNPGAKNVNADGSIDRGLWQINSVHGKLSTFDRVGNAKAAVRISGNGSNWRPWVTFKTGAYRQFLGAGGKPAPMTRGERAAQQGFAGTQDAASTASGQAESSSGLVGPGGGGYGQKVSDAELGQATATAKDNLAGLLKALKAERTLKRRRLRKIRKALRGRLRPETRKRLTEEATTLVGELADLDESIKEYTADQKGGATTVTQAEQMDAGVMPDTGDAGGGGDAGGSSGAPESDPALEANTRAIEEHTAALKGVEAELKRQTDLATSSMGSDQHQLYRFVGDIFSGHIGRGIVNRGQTAGFGVEWTS